jgi:hypothetical protein
VRIPDFDRLLASFPRPNDPLGFQGTWREHAVKQGVLPVFSDWEVGYSLTADGEPVSSQDDNWKNPQPVHDAKQHNVILALAAARFPEVAFLRPIRGPNDPDCPNCRGAGGIAGYPALTCECGNLGWVPASSSEGA